MDKVYPPWGPNRYKWSTDNPITIIVGEPLDLTAFVEELKQKYADELDQIIAVTDHLQEIIYKMRLEVEKVHLDRLKELRPDQVDEFLSTLVPYEPPKARVFKYLPTVTVAEVFIENVFEHSSSSEY